MTPDSLIAAIESLIESFLLIHRDFYPPANKPGGAYKYRSAQEYKDASLASEREEYNKHDISLQTKLLRKTMALLLFSCFDPSEYLAKKEPIRQLVDTISHMLLDWLTMRSLGKIGTYYVTDGLKLKIVEELPDVPKLLQLVRDFLVPDMASMDCSLVVPGEGPDSFRLENDEHTLRTSMRMGMHRLGGVDARLVQQVIGSVEVMPVEPGDPDWAVSTVWLPIMAEIPETNVRRRAGWVQLPLRCSVTLIGDLASNDVDPEYPAEPPPAPAAQ